MNTTRTVMSSRCRGQPAGVAGHQRQNRMGFTLIELLVVIAIIGVLISLTVPALKNAMASAQRAGCIMNQRQYGGAFHLYAADNENFLPMHYKLDDATSSLRPWTAQLHEANVLLHSQQEALVCPANQLRPHHDNQCLAKYMYHALAGSHSRGGQWEQHRISDLKKPASMPLLGDASDFHGNGKARYYFYSTTANGWMYLGFELHGGANVLFADGRVSSGLQLDTFNPDWANPSWHGF